MPKETVKLISSEGFEFIVDYKAACISNTVKSVLSMEGALLICITSAISKVQLLRAGPERAHCVLHFAAHWALSVGSRLCLDLLLQRGLEISNSVLSKFFAVAISDAQVGAQGVVPPPTLKAEVVQATLAAPQHT